MLKRILAPVVLATAFSLSACETREESLIRAQGYLDTHPVEEVANYDADVVYASVDGYDLTLDVSWPEGEGPFPCLVIIHGGGWKKHINNIMQGMARYITNRGYAVFNINYRTLPEGVTMQQIVEDCFGAIIWVKEHAPEYNGDPDRIAVTGDSAGGHLTAMVVTQGTSPEFAPTYKGSGKYDVTVNCAIPTYGAFDFKMISRMSGDIYTKDILGVSYRKDPELYERFSPQLHIREDLVPQLVICGDRDPLFLLSQVYVKKLEEKGAPVEFHVVKGKSHAFLDYYWEDETQECYDRMIEFLDDHLK